MRKITYIILLLISVNTLVFSQQDPQYSQYQFNQMVINPAYAGAKDAMSVVLDVRNQWSGFSGAPNTQAISFHTPLKNKHIGLGLSAYNDMIGPKRVTAAYGNFSYILSLNTHLKLSFGLRAGLVNYVFDFNKINYKDQNEINAFSTVPANKIKPDMDAGIFLKSNSFYAGISATHLNAAYIYKDNLSYTNATGSQMEYDLTYRLNTHLFFIISKGFSAGDNLVINPTLMIKTASNTLNADLNLNFLLKQRLWLGVYTRSSGTVGLLAQVLITQHFRIGYSYDRTLGRVQKNLGNGHEIMIGFDFDTFKSKILSPRYLN